MVRTFLMMTAVLTVGTLFGWEYDQVDKVDLDPLGKIVDGWKAAKPAGVRKVLWFSECFGYNHHGGRCYGDWTFKRAGEVHGTWAITQITDVKLLADKGFLKDFDAICFCNSSGLKAEMAPGMETALADFVKGGKGIALIHAGLDAFKDSDRLLDLFGGYFRGHPWHGDGTWRFLNEQPANPINASFRNEPASFSAADEIYQFPAFFDRRTCNVLISMDLTDPMTKEAELWWEKFFGAGSTRPDHDYAVSWTKTAGKGRIFYTSFGHDRQAFLDARRLYHMFAGLQYVLGDLEPVDPVTHAPDIPDLRTDWAGGPWREKLNKMAKGLQGQSLDFVIFGDSITMGWTYSATNRWPGGKEVWAKHWGNLKTANFGMSGDRTEHLLWRIEKDGQADGWTAKTIFLMIGINNRGQVRPGAKATDTPEQAAKGARAIVDALKRRHPESRLVVLGALPVANKDGLAWVARYNRLLAGFEEPGKVDFRDVNGGFLRDGGQIGDLFNDGLHPNPAGYEVYAAAIDRILAE